MKLSRCSQREKETLWKLSHFSWSAQGETFPSQKLIWWIFPFALPHPHLLIHPLSLALHWISVLKWKRLGRWIWLLANHGNTPSLWQKSTTTTASLVPRQCHTTGVGNAGGSVWSWTDCLLPVREATPRTTTSWPGKLETEGFCSEWSLELERAKKPREPLVIPQGTANTFLPSVPSACFSSVCYWSPVRAHTLPVYCQWKLFLNILLMKAQSTLWTPCWAVPVLEEKAVGHHRALNGLWKHGVQCEGKTVK